MPDDFAGKVIIVTGAASGMGRGCAIHLAGRGARVAILDVDRAGLAETERELKATGAEVYAATVSVADEAAVDAFVGNVGNRWGGIDGLVHAGAILRYGISLDTSLATWEEVIRVNLTGTFLICRAVGRAMVEGSRKGAIVNIASVAATMGLSTLSAYSASKGGVASFTRAMAKELLPYGIRVNFICPGFVETGMTRDILANEATREARGRSTGIDRVCQPEDIAMACAFLLGEGSQFIAGHGLYIDSAASIAGN